MLKQTQPQSAPSSGLAGELGFMRNRAGAKPGKPVYFGERPADRPLADALPGAGYSAKRAADLRSSKEWLEANPSKGKAKPSAPRRLTQAELDALPQSPKAYPST